MENAMLQLPVLFLPFRSPGAKELVFVADGTRGYALRSIQCTRVFVDSSWRRVLCDACHCLTKMVSTICQQSTARTSRPINCTTRVEDVSPSKLPQLIDVVRKRKRYEAHDATCREQRLRERLFDQSVPLEFEEDKDNIHDCMEVALPFAAKKFGKDSDEYIVFQEMFCMSQDPKQPRYHEATFRFALSLIAKMDIGTYEKIRKVLFLPSHRHMIQIRNDLVGGDECLSDGPRRAVIKYMAELAKEKGWAGHNLDIILSFDSMVMRGEMILSNHSNRIIGVVMGDESAIQKEFQCHVQKLRSEQDGNKDQSFENEMSEVLTLKKDHMVFYAKSANPGWPLCFICGVHNLVSTNSNPNSLMPNLQIQVALFVSFVVFTTSSQSRHTTFIQC
jgi:hypothetical protein